jgi:hypothetical protein
MSTADDVSAHHETLYRQPPPSPAAESHLDRSWWSGYRAQLAKGGLSETAVQVVDDDCGYLLDRGVHGVGPAGSQGWPASRVRSGLVMGAVQSGKTASMLGLAAKSLDAGVDAVIVLAGTRTALWQQTYDRLVAQLDQPDLGDPPAGERRTMLPAPRLMRDGGEVPLSRLYTLNGPQTRRMLGNGTPLICVAMKNVHHLRALADTLRRQLWPAVERAGRPFHILVLDDEADDGSVLDARVEQTVDPVLGDLKQIPRAIVDLWETRPHTGESASPHLHATYIGYTATPQANFLQADHNPLAPRDFVVGLRTPFDAGTVQPRQTTYLEPEGLGSYYCGGEVFYRRLRDCGLTPEPKTSPVNAARDALQAFLVAGAIRLWRDPGRVGFRDGRDQVFGSSEEASAGLARPHSMLVHPSAAIEDHFAAAAVLLEAAGLEEEEARDRVRAGSWDLPVEPLVSSLSDRQPEWLNWVTSYSDSAHAVASTFSLFRPPRTPTAQDWPAIRDLLRDQVIPGTRVAVVNSDDQSDERPSFEVVQSPEGWVAPSSHSTIFVSGNVMSRGLTLEGLATTLFLRRSGEPLADTQMQMQRWFGYRGRDLELCRVFVPAAQRSLFAAYHEADEALRRHVVHLMAENPEVAPTPQVLQGRDFLATGKLARLRNVPLCPGAFPFVRLMNDGQQPDPNAGTLVDLFVDQTSTEVSVQGTLRGRLLDRALTLTEAAALLDRLRYDAYRPDPEGWDARRWAGVAAHADVQSGDPEGLYPLYRPPAPDRSYASVDARRDCPYTIAAYLRLWQACLTRHARGLVPTDDPSTPWSMVSLAQRQAAAPAFRVGIRYGSAEAAVGEPFTRIPFQIRAMRRDVLGSALTGTWGTRNPGGGPSAYLGDSYFDYHVDPGPPPIATGGATWRPVGAPGLVLFHVVDRGPGRHPTVAVGVAIPLGGPDQFAARESR